MKHDKSHFYKYVSMDTALKVVDSLSFRWSSPVHFNDPFDHQTGFRFTFTGEELASELHRLFVSVANNERIFNPEYPTSFGIVLRHLANVPVDERLNGFLEAVEPVLHEFESDFNNACEQLNRDLIQHYNHSRVFCVSESNDSAAMWAHYADNHKGVVFKLACIEELDNALTVAQPVQYTDEILEFPSLEEYIQDTIGEIKLNLPQLSTRLAYFKHKDWEYEKEWRVLYPMLEEPAGDGYSYNVENPRIFEEIYIGCRALTPEVEKIKNALRNNLSHIKIFRTSPSKSRFTFEFEEDEI